MKMKKFFSLAAVAVAVFGMASCAKLDNPIVVDEPSFPKGDFELVQEVTDLNEIGSTPFVIVNVAELKAFYGPDAQNLAFGDIAEALKKTNANIAFKAEAFNDNYLLRAITPAGEEYSIWGSPGYLNAQALETGWCSFILGLGGDLYGQDIQNGAVWNIEYVAGQGFAIKNIGTGKYLKDAGNANQDEPTFFSFYTYQEVAK